MVRYLTQKKKVPMQCELKAYAPAVPPDDENRPRIAGLHYGVRQPRPQAREFAAFFKTRGLHSLYCKNPTTY